MLFGLDFYWFSWVSIGFERLFFLYFFVEIFFFFVEFFIIFFMGFKDFGIVTVLIFQALWNYL